MEIIIRYKNGSLYSKSEQAWITLEDVGSRDRSGYQVMESATKKDITDEVRFLADVDRVRRKGLWSRAFVGVDDA